MLSFTEVVWTIKIPLEFAMTEEQRKILAFSYLIQWNSVIKYLATELHVVWSSAALYAAESLKWMVVFIIEQAF